MQLNEGVVTDPYQGIAWYPFYASTTGRGINLEADGGSWATFKATEMKIYANVEFEESNSFKIQFLL